MDATEQAKQWIKDRLRAETAIKDECAHCIALAAMKILAILKRNNIPDKTPYERLPRRVQREIDNVIQWLIDELTEDVELLAVPKDGDKNYLIPFIMTPVYGQTLLTRIRFWADKFATELLNEKAPLSSSKGALYGITRLLRHTISIAWMEEWKRRNEQQGAVFFRSFRGSSYPCAQCDDEQSAGLQPIANYPLGGWHPNCLCIFVFYDQLGNPINNPTI